MKRLIDQVEDGVGMERLTQLVSAAEPFRPNPFTKKRVQQELHGVKSSHKPLLKPLLTTGGLVLVVGSAVAGAGWWRARQHVAPSAMTSPAPSIPASPPPATLAPALSPTPARREATASSEMTAPVEIAAPPQMAALPEATLPDTVAKEGGNSPPKTHGAKRRSGAPTDEGIGSRSATTAGDDAVQPSPATAAGEDPTPVALAIRALRNDRNPAQAEQLLQEYLRTNPRGALVEDALALLIETASAQRSATAVDRATKYLERYPNGRYRATARRVLSSRP